jgi:myo-inositol-1(or 4)-monophosphatase
LTATDIVTECDKAVEAIVSSRLSSLYPSFSFMGEETYKPGDKLGPEPTFICDPIDGTLNFVHGFPHACISLGLAVDRVPVVGVVYNPWFDTMYTAIKGQGAFVRSPKPTFGKPLAVGEDAHQTRRLPLVNNNIPLVSLNTALVLSEYGATRDGSIYDAKTETMTKLAAAPGSKNDGPMVHGIRMMGSAALDLCTVATGGVDVYWEGGCWPWDVCAGWAILTEAGGKMVGANPGMWENEIDSRLYLAVRPSPDDQGQKEIVEEFWAAMGNHKLDY